MHQKIKHADLVTYLVISTSWFRQGTQLHISFISCSQTFYCNIVGRGVNKPNFPMCFLFNMYFIWGV